MKKFLLILLIVILVVGAILVALFYFKPKFVQNIFIPEIDQVEKADISVRGDTADLRIQLHLKNKGPFKMNFDSLEYHVKFDTLLILSRTQDLSVVLGPGDNDTLVLPVSLPFKRLFARIKQLQERDSADITTEVRVVYKTIFGSRSLKHKKTNRIGMPRPPEFELVKVKFAGLKHGKILLDAHLKMTNPGNLRMSVTGLKFELVASDILHATGRHSEKIDIKPRSVMERVIRVEATLDRPLKAAFQLGSKKKTTPYHVVVTGSVEAENLGDKPMLVRIEKSGVF